MKNRQSPSDSSFQCSDQQHSPQDVKKGPWKQFQDRIYQQFIQQHEEYFRCEYYRRSNQVFKNLSEILRNQRTPEQCKSHHERMKQMTKNGTIPEIIQYLDRKYQKKQKKIQKKSLPDPEKPKHRPTASAVQGKEGKVCNGHELEVVGAGCYRVWVNLGFLGWW